MISPPGLTTGRVQAHSAFIGCTPKKGREAHPGFCCADGKYIAIPKAGGSADAARRLDADGEVAPGSTAERVWPGAYLLASYLQQPHVEQEVLESRPDPRAHLQLVPSQAKHEPRLV